MGWTSERVELLKKLWSEGLPASKIAAQIGGLSRCAVIGKKHRLGLASRVKTPRVPVPRAQQRCSKKLLRLRHNNKKRWVGNGDEATVDKRAALSTTEEAASSDPADTVPAEGTRVSIMELNAFTCRWPIGYPGKKDFYYCGRQPKAGFPYCPHHVRLAYQSRTKKI